MTNGDKTLGEHDMSKSQKPRPRIPRPDPLTNGDERPDKDPTTGRFTKGNKAAVGRAQPFAERRAQYTRMLMDIPDEAVKAVIDKLVECAKAGEQWAVKELFDRVLGRPLTHTSRPHTEVDYMDMLQMVVDDLDDDEDEGGYGVDNNKIEAWLDAQGIDWRNIDLRSSPSD